MSLPAGRELDAQIAFHLFGWRWFERVNEIEGVRRCALYPPDNAKWIRWNFYSAFEQIEGWPEPERRFSDWDRCGSPAEYREHPSLGWLPKFSAEWEGMRLVVERMRELGWSFSCRCPLAHCTAWFGLPDGDKKFYKESETLPHAVALAALAALEGEGK